LKCINQHGKEFNIAPLVTRFSITEELFSPVLVMSLHFRDTINFFEDFGLSGEERIIVELERDRSVEKKRSFIKLSFAVKEYPNYQKTASEPNVQEYNVIAISEFGYASRLMKISRSVKGNPLDGISKIFKEDLSVPIEIDDVTKCVSSFDGIITIQSPLKAVEWLRSKSFDVNSAPIFVYSIISSPKIIVKSLTDIWNAIREFPAFEYKQFLNNRVGSANFYDENKNRILDMQSNIKLDKLEQASKGGFASKVSVTDIANKTFSNIIFDYSKDSIISSNKIDSKSPFSFAKNLILGADTNGGKSFSDIADASTAYISTNSTANYEGAPNSVSGPIIDNISRAKSYYANLEGVSHQILVYGDFNLNPGKKVRIHIPKAINKTRKETTQLDESLSGDYIIAVAAHLFKDGIYTVKLKIIKDA
jgi:hypothetical protein